MTEVDAYKTNCYCGSWVNISADGDTVISTDSMQLRLGRVGSKSQTIVDITSNEMSSIRLTAAGDRVFFMMGRDAALTSSTSETLLRGIYVVDDDGGNLRQLVGPEQIANLLGITPDTVGMLRLQSYALDVSADGTHVIFGAYVGPETAVFLYDDASHDLRLLRGSLAYVQRVAMSGDGATVAYDVVPLNTDSANNEIEAAPFGGGAPRQLATKLSSGFDAPLQLTEDGSRLLVSHNSLLIDTATGDRRQLAASIPGAGGNHEAVLTDGLAWATMNADATRFLYAIRTVRCADCANLHEQLAILELDPAELGDAPSITDAEITPPSIGLERESAAKAQATVDSSGTIVGVGLIAMRDGVLDVNVANGVLLHDDGQNGDATPSDGVFTADNIVHTTYEARESDTGPRVIRIAAEVKSSDGRRHATAVEIGELTVGSVSMRGGTPAAGTSLPTVRSAAKRDLAVVR
jgi:hypothetical protein